MENNNDLNQALKAIGEVGYNTTWFRDHPHRWPIASLPVAYAGAIVDRSSLTNLKKKTFDIKAHLERYDSYTLLRDTGNSIILTGSTGTNVGDVMLYLLPSSVKT
jgi:hypothetical protein